MNPRSRKILSLLLAAVLLFGAGRVQQSMNVDRDRLGMTHAAALQNAPPLLAFTTVALGGFRGLISNYLWIRSNDLQLDDKFFEAAQLANWITDLEPHFPQVWIFQAWNMAYNISVKFKDFPDRWRWLENGIELLRDKGLQYNPDELLMYRELAWFFQHKMGQNMDDANLYYKFQWAEEMAPLFGGQGTNIAALLNPQTPQEKTNAMVLREKYKMDPALVARVDAEWGPLDWRLPEAHAIYWGSAGLERANRHPDRVKADDIISVRRTIYQSIYQAFKHGRLLTDPLAQRYSLGPNLELIPKVNDAYMTMYREEQDSGMKQGILRAHRNFLRDAIYFLYENNRMADAAKWFKTLGDMYPNVPILDGDPNSLPKNLTLDEYSVRRVEDEVKDTSEEKTTAVVQGMLTQAYYSLAIGDDDRYAGFKLLAGKIYEHYNKNIHGSETRIPLPPYDLLNRTALNSLLDPQNGIPYAGRAAIRSQLGMPAETNAPPSVTGSTNLVTPAVTSTNVPAVTNGVK